MAALTAAVLGMTHQGNPTIIGLPASAADTFYKGAILCFVAAGGVSPTVTGIGFAGICTETIVIAAAGDLVEVQIDGVVTFSNTDAVLADAGGLLYSPGATAYDNPADAIADAGGTNQLVLGKVLTADTPTVTLELHGSVVAIVA